MPLSIADTVRLRNGVEMPRFGLGTYKSPEGGQVEGAVRTALETGYRLIDTASLYENEEGVARALSASGVPRDEVFITTKVWNGEQGYEETLAAAHRSLERLDTDYVDLYLVHWPIPRLMEGTWRAMEELLSAGRTRAIGVCNFLPHHLEMLDDIAREPAALNQFELHPRLQQPELVAACRDREIVVQAWAPLMRGGVFRIPEVVRIAEEHGKDPAQVALRWLLQRGITTIPKSVRTDRVVSNAQIFDFELTEREMIIIDGLDTGDRIGKHPDSFSR